MKNSGFDFQLSLSVRLKGDGYGGLVALALLLKFPDLGSFKKTIDSIWAMLVPHLN